MSETKKQTSAWAPLAVPVFRSLWIALLVSNIGTWFHDVGAAWTMAEMAPSPLLVALVQSATTLPFFLFAFPSGMLADLVNRRRLLIWVNAMASITAASLAVFAILDGLSPIVLIVFTFMLGICASLAAPSWQAIVPDLVERDMLPSAVALNGVGINLARAVGPALGGILLAVAGPAVVFSLNSLSFIFVLVTLVRWKSAHTESDLPKERFISGLATGLVFVLHSSAFKKVLLRAGMFMLGGSAFWSLIPLVAKRELGLSSMQYGLLLGAFGVGAVVGANFMGAAKKKLGANCFVIVCGVGFGLVTAALAAFFPFLVMCAVLVGAGFFWMGIVSSMNVASQSVLPSWVRARGLSIYLMVFFGGMGVGSILWGSIAEYLGLVYTLYIASGAIVAASLAGGLIAIQFVPDERLVPAPGWSEPALQLDPIEMAQSRIQSVKRYQVKLDQLDDFLAAMAELRHVRKRNGALSWMLYRDAEDERTYIESFTHASWNDHILARERHNQQDAEVEKMVVKVTSESHTSKADHWISVMQKL